MGAPDRQHGDLHYELGQVLHAHWLHDLCCSHEGEGSNQPMCGCGWLGDRVANVGLAKSQWVNHVLEEMRPHLVAWRAQEHDS
jgi:hypothetical protein